MWFASATSVPLSVGSVSAGNGMLSRARTSSSGEVAPLGAMIVDEYLRLDFENLVWR
jgi:hypothetical protein